MSALIVVIPTLNAASGLPATLASLGEGVRAIIVADGGSTDDTVAIARAAGCLALTGARGRGAQLAQGGALALRMAGPEDVLVFLHADTVLEPGWSAAARTVMTDASRRDLAGHFRFALDDDSRPARRLARMVALRCRVFGLPYGDQGLVIPARFYAALGGYRPMELFEDVDLVRRIGRRRLVEIPARAVTSADRFRREGYLRRSARNLVLLMRYLAGAPPSVLARAYRR